MFLKVFPCFKDRVATDLENLEIQRKTHGIGNIVKISGKTHVKFEFLIEKTWKTQGNCKMCVIITDEIASIFSLLPCSGKN